MPNSRMRYKAGKLTFLLVCLFFCVACGKTEAVFESGSVPVRVSEIEKTVTEEEIVETQPEMVNINIADIEELMTLPGIGEVRAAAIIDYRQQVGSFEKIEDIMNVKGIKTGIFSKINSLICVK